jgi:perosamine synthetase
VSEFFPPARPSITQAERSTFGILSSYVMDTGMLTNSEYVIRFEQKFNEVQKLSGDCVAVNSCSAGLFLIYQALDLAGHHVVVPTNTFFTTAAAAIHAGAIVSFADCDPDTLCVSLDTIREACTEDTKAVVVVHIGGVIPPDMEEIVHFCTDNNIYLIEDCAHAHGCSLNGKSAGDFGYASAFSFYPTKILTTGEGGIVHSMDSDLLCKIRALRDHGKTDSSTNLHTLLGFNWRMSEFAAILGYSQCSRLREFVEKRSNAAAIYDAVLEDAGLTGSLKYEVFQKNGLISSFYKYVFKVNLTAEDKTLLKSRMREEFNICLSGNVYDTPLHEQPIFADYLGTSVLPSECPVAEDVCRNHICLPIYSDMTSGQAFVVADNFRKVFQQIEG